MPESERSEFRLAARWAGTYRDSDQFDTERYRCPHLRDPRVDGDEFNAYVRRDSFDEGKMSEILREKIERPVMLELELREGASGQREVLVVDWVAEGWCRRLW